VKRATFVGHRDLGVCTIMVVEESGITSLFNYADDCGLRDLQRLDWGDSSLASSLTAYLILYLVMGSPVHVKHYHPDFLREVVARMPLVDWEMTEGEVMAYTHDLARRRVWRIDRHFQMSNLDALIGPIGSQ